MLSSQLHATTEILPLAGLDRLAEHLPTAWIEEALAATGTASIRRRRLPAEQVVWLVIALALYRHQSMPEVLAALDLALPSATELPVSKSAVTQARQRLGAKVGPVVCTVGRPEGCAVHGPKRQPLPVVALGILPAPGVGRLMK